MSPKGTIVAHRVWKRFRADRGRRLLRDQLQMAGSRLRGGSDVKWRWALRDVELRAERGESVGLIGTNGSGKSTLLKILTRVMYPYAGGVEVSGRVGALIEVRAGIHPDLSGRENVFLYGSLLGLKRAEVTRRFDEIVEFAEISDAIDRQVKFYSSGMQMRLGFAVAAFLEPDVLLVDEVLAVGDATFQQRCLDRMQTVLAQGTTLVFVSHDLASVQSVCARCLWLHEGVVRADGDAREVLGRYRQAIEESAELAPAAGAAARLSKVDIAAPANLAPQTQQPLEIRLSIESEMAWSGNLFVGVSEGPATPIFVLRRALQLRSGETLVRCVLARLPLPRGRFFLWVGCFGPAGTAALLPWRPAANFDVFGPELDGAPGGVVRLAPVHVEATWEIDEMG